MYKHKPTIKTTNKSICTGALSRIFVGKVFRKLLSKGLWQSLYFVKFNAFSIFFWIPLDGCIWSMKTILWGSSYLDIQTIFTLQKPRCKSFWWNYNKSESCKSYLVNKEKLLFLVVFRSDVNVDFYFARPFFTCAFGRGNKIARQKNRTHRSKFVQPSFYFNWKIMPLCQILSKTSEISRKIPLT